MARSLLILQMPSLPKQLSMHGTYSYDAELAQSSREWIGSHIGLKANTVAYHLRPPAMKTCSVAWGQQKDIDSANALESDRQKTTNYRLTTIKFLFSLLIAPAMCR
jgi:hypothetical protein